ncbi:hypothetical protein K4F52_009587 [Lecanicillium sp. MT-2017a]|nr:hypothetical protein K4F52_009587 [Lecanicillium sp. MT-2017a]
MKFLALCTLATSVAAGALVQRDVKPITDVLSGIGADLVNLDGAVKDFSGDPAPLLDASNKLIQSLKDGNTKVQPLPMLTLTEALALQAPTKDLQAKGETLLADLKAKKEAIAAAGLCEATFIQASSINTASQALIKTVVSKVPEAAQSIAQTLVAPLLKALNEAQDAFSPENCQGGGNPPTTGGPQPTTTKPGPTTGGPGPTTNGPQPTTTPGNPGGGTCPAASTVTVTTTDTRDCTATPTCTKSPVVTVTSTTRACPTGSKLPW